MLIIYLSIYYIKSIIIMLETVKIFLLLVLIISILILDLYYTFF